MKSEEMEGFERRIEFEPPFDKRSPDQTRNYGVHGVEIRFVLIGTEGAVQFLLYTNWMLPEVQSELDRNKFTPRSLSGPLAVDLGYHRPVPRYEGQGTSGPCQYLAGKRCYYDGSGLAAERIFDVLLREGSDGVWARLEGYYRAVFLGKLSAEAVAEVGTDA